jgi:hypothetical protein
MDHKFRDDIVDAVRSILTGANTENARPTAAVASAESLSVNERLHITSRVRHTGPSTELEPGPSSGEGSFGSKSSKYLEGENIGITGLGMKLSTGVVKVCSDGAVDRCDSGFVRLTTSDMDSSDESV